LSDIASFLSTVPACAGMSGLELNTLAAFLEPLRLAPSEILFREGEGGSAMYFVRTGSMGAWVMEDEMTRREVYEFLPGSHLGEMAIAEGSVRSATAYAKTEVSLLALDALDFHRLVWEHPGLAVKLLGNMARNLAAWLDEAADYLGDLARWGENARRKAVVDESTGLFNRRFLEEAIRAREGRGIDARRPCALVAFDLDRFHDVNENLGNPAGDAVIAQIGALVQSMASTAGFEGIVPARLSGDEFSILLPDATKEEATAFAEGLRLAIEELFIEFRAGPGAVTKRLSITASFGIAEAPRDAYDGQSLVACADGALAQAKAEGRNCVRCAEDDAIACLDESVPE